ncbi:hypothetical protein EIZ62_03655 [Streptomyces ficellus]|uniref:Uncharacterized protein n=1 Tax=Streptomyces ficellus TaxID=1977088 RepID=A0A6I6FWU2_9ACTN|nr:hypothetical protein EIZ62_03655 [Streptomyces ficellus]
MPQQPQQPHQPAAAPLAPVRRPAADSPWATARAAERTDRATSRMRRVVEGLPDWEPLPPGETFVRRPGSAP